MKILFRGLFLLTSMFTMFLVTSCFDASYLKYDISHSGVYFTKDSLNYTFGVTPTEVNSYEYRIPVKIMGGLSDADREIAYEVIPVTVDAAAVEYLKLGDISIKVAEEGKHYQLGKAVIKKDSIEGYIPITFLRENLAGNYNDGYEYYSLSIRLVENGCFVPTLDSISQARTIIFTNAIVEPDWFNYKNEKIWRPGNPHSKLGEWHPYKYMMLAKFFKNVKAEQPETYKKMVEYYGGENLERVPYGDFYPYLHIMQKYVLYPMYQYFTDEDNLKNIKEKYPDFPEDFPNPYE